MKTLNDIQEPLNELVEDVKSVLGSSLSKIILYGSYARGEQTEYSDIDIMVLTSLEDEEEIKKREDELFDLAYDIAFESLLTLSVIVKNEKHFYHWVNDLPFYRNVEQEGVVLVA
jgi:predicted nucleotidyltransferase